MPCLVRHVCTVGERGAGLPSTGMVLELACLGFAGRGTSVGEIMAAGVAVRIFVWIRRLAYRIEVLVSESSGVGVSQLLAGLD